MPQVAMDIDIRDSDLDINGKVSDIRISVFGKPVENIYIMERKAKVSSDHSNPTFRRETWRGTQLLDPGQWPSCLTKSYESRTCCSG